MKYEMFSRIALAEDLPQENLRRGDVATIIEFYKGRSGQEPGYELEVFNAVGDTLAVVTVRESQIEALRSDEILNARARKHQTAVTLSDWNRYGDDDLRRIGIRRGVL